MVFMMILRFLLALIALSGQTNDNYSEGVLQPNTVYRGIDGVGIDTQFAVLKGQPQISIKQIEDISSFPPLYTGQGVNAVTPYYEITVPEDINAGRTQDERFIISVPLPPLPAGVSPENLAVFTLADNADVEVLPPRDEPLTEGYTWFSSSATYVAATNEMIFSRGGFSSSKPFRFVIVSGWYSQ
jgi:hypothetical protein